MEKSCLNTLLLDNLINPETFEKNPSSIKIVECFLFNLPVNPVFTDFTNLQELRIIEQDIVDMKWTNGCPKLVKLSIYHTKLSNTDGLSNLIYLKQLFLEANQITSFPDITPLKSLNELSLAQNQIGEISNYPVSASLQVLNISSVGITYVSDDITNFPNLKVLRVAGNQLSSFSSVLAITKLINLNELSFYDPMYGENPICKLPNYDIIPASLFPTVSVLDTYQVSEKFRAMCNNKRKNAKLYYFSSSAFIMAEIYQNILRTRGSVNSIVSKVIPKQQYSQAEFEVLYKKLNQYEASCRSRIDFLSDMYNLMYENGGSLLFENTNISSIEHEVSQLFDKNFFDSFDSCWRIVYSEGIDDSKQDNFKYSAKYYNSTKELFENIIRCETCEGNDNYSNDNNFSPNYVIVFKQSEILSYPLYLFCISHSKELIHNIEHSSLSFPIRNDPVYNEYILYSLSSTFDLRNNLKEITLIDCGITSLSIFSDLNSLEKLSIPFNMIDSLEDFPFCANLKYIDLSFNKISTINDLKPINLGSTKQIENILLYGNPVYTTKIDGFLIKYFPSISNTNIVQPIISNTYYESESIFVSSLFPKQSFDSIIELNLSNQCVTSILALEKLNKLQKLTVTDNLLTSLDFSSSSIIYINASMNNISSFPSYSNFPNIEVLILSSNQLSGFLSCPSLLVLDVSFNNIVDVPSPEFYPNLISLSLIDNPLVKMINELRIVFSLPGLKMLNGSVLSSQVLSKAKSTYSGVLFSESVDSMLRKNPRTLSINGEGLKDIDCLKSKDLIELDVSSNNISAINWLPGTLPSLGTLKLANNSITYLGFCASLSSLRVLDISSNRISDEVFLSFCSITHHRLNTLNISSNIIKQLDRIPSKSFPCLEHIDFSHNRICQISPSCFESKLLSLNLSYNSLRKLDYLEIPSLEALDLSHNRVTSVDEVEKLRGCVRLQKFSFNDNPLSQRISHRIRCLSILRSLRELDCKTVTENDQNQVQIILEQNGNQQTMSGRGSKVNTVTLQPALPPLQAPAPITRKKSDPSVRFPK